MITFKDIQYTFSLFNEMLNDVRMLNDASVFSNEFKFINKLKKEHYYDIEFYLVDKVYSTPKGSNFKIKYVLSSSIGISCGIQWVSTGKEQYIPITQVGVLCKQNTIN